MGNQPSETVNNNTYNNKSNKHPTPISEAEEISYDDALIMTDNTVSMTVGSTPAFSSTNTSTRTSSNRVSAVSKISNEMIHINRMRHSKEESIHNGIIGIYLSSKSVKIAFDFWTTTITDLNMSDLLEIGCSIFFGMVASDTDIKNIFLGNHNNPAKLETVSLKFMDMMGYLIRSLLRDDVTLYSNMKLLGTLHSKAGVTIKMYDKMLTAMHHTFVYYFSDQYTTKVKHALDDVFTVVSRIMTNQNLEVVINDMTIVYLESLNKCFLSLDGRSALLSYLKQCGCRNIALFYELLCKYKSKTKDMERFMVARDIVRFNIDGVGGNDKKIDISWKTTQNVLVEMQKLDDLWFRNMPFSMDILFFDGVEREVNQFILKRYWNAFKESVLLSYY